MSKSLFNISEEMTLLEEIIENGDATEEDDWLVQWFEDLQEGMTGKVDNYAALIQSFIARAKALRDEQKRMADRAQTYENNAHRLKDRLVAFFQVHDIKALDTPRYRVTAAKNGGKAPLIVPDDPSKIDEKFLKMEPRIDKVAIREALESGEEIDGCCIGERGTSLRIK